MEKEYPWIIKGSQRTKIIKSMDKIKTPTQIKNDTKLSLNNVSDILREFKKKKIATCINESEKTGRIYKLTKKGLRIRDQIIE
jgi:predicted transcriptional regulator